MDITVNQEAALHAGCGFTCRSQPTQIISGSSSVRFHGEFAARAFDDTAHGGKLIIGSGNVVIGGPSGMGSVGAGAKLCEKAAAGRASGSKKQSYGNCVLESVRQLLLKAGNDVSEDELVSYATAKGIYSPAGVVNGGDKGRQLLEEFGISAERMPAKEPATIADVKQAVADGRGVVAFVDGPSWFPGVGPGGHAIVVTGVELDDQGNVVAVFVNDTGDNQDNCGQRVPISRFQPAFDKNGSRLLVTKGSKS